MPNNQAHDPRTASAANRATPNITLTCAPAPAGGGGGSGSLANGQTLTITGTGFGAVADPQPYARDVQDEYASPSQGATIPLDNWAGNGDVDHDVMVFDNAVALPGRTWSAKTSTRKARFQTIQAAAGAPSRVADKTFASFWYYANESINSQPTAAASIALKLMRFGTDGLNLTRPTFEVRKQWCAMENDAGTFLCPYSSEFDETDVNNVSGCLNGRYVYGFNPAGVAGQWVRIDFSIYSHTLADLHVNGKRILGDGLNGGMPYRKSPDDRTALPQINNMGTDVGTQADLNTTYRGRFSDINQLVSPARIEFSNSPTWDDSAEQTIYLQRCTSRTDSQIVVTPAFFGGLDLGSPVYMHVLNADGSEATTVELIVGTNVVIS